MGLASRRGWRGRRKLPTATLKHEPARIDPGIRGPLVPVHLPDVRAYILLRVATGKSSHRHCTAKEQEMSEGHLRLR